MTGVQDILTKVPKNAPYWSVGITTVLVSLIFCFATTYVIIRPEVQKYMDEGYLREHTKDAADTNVLSTILGVMKSNTEQITLLSTTLNAVQQNNIMLTEKISRIEKETDTTRVALSSCEDKLRSLKK